MHGLAHTPEKEKKKKKRKIFIFLNLKRLPELSTKDRGK